MRHPLFAKFQKGIISLLILGLIVACTPRTSAVDPFVSSSENPDITTAASAQAVAERFLEAWQAEDYAAMYRMLSTLSHDAITETDFQNYYEDAANRLTLDFIDFQVLSTMAKTHQAEVAYRVDFNTRVFGVPRLKCLKIQFQTIVSPISSVIILFQSQQSDALSPKAPNPPGCLPLR